MNSLLRPLVLAAAVLAGVPALALAAPPAAAAASQPVPAVSAAAEADIRKAWAARLPKLPPVDEVRATPLPGIYELRYGETEIVYGDARLQFIFEGSLIDLASGANVTEQRIAQLTAVDFAQLPFADAFELRQGSGARKLAVFVDPNCGYCKRLEMDLVRLKDVSISVFVIPILGPDSNLKARNIWCAKDRGRSWRDWMLLGQQPPAAAADCDAKALARNRAFAQRYRIDATPALFFEDGTRQPGAVSGAEVERLLVAATAAVSKKTQ